MEQPKRVLSFKDTPHILKGTGSPRASMSSAAERAKTGQCRVGLSALNLAVIMIDGVYVEDHVPFVALGTE